MFKDPFQLEETPYDLLGLEPNASPKEVQEALPRFMRDRKNLPRLALAQQAIRKLKTPADRALTYTIACIVAAIVVFIILGIVVGIVVGIFAGVASL